MKNLEYREYYQRSLPHFQPQGATFLVNFRLASSLPVSVIEKLQQETKELERRLAEVKEDDQRAIVHKQIKRQHIDNWDDALHAIKHGTFYLREYAIARIVADSIRFHDSEWFDLVAYCIMPNHVHLVITPLKNPDGVEYSLSQIMHNIKRNSGKQANILLNRTGPFWQHESYDHFIRNEAEFIKTIEYVLLNPVKAGLVEDWTQWKWSYCKHDLQDEIVSRPTYPS
jgi:putative transposase